MDPDATLAVLMDETAPFNERISAAGDLHGWLLQGGFAPTDELTQLPYNRDRIIGYCLGFVRASVAVRAMPEVVQLRCDLEHIAERNTQHVVDSSARLLEVIG